MKLAGYVRVSTPQQAEMFGLPVQREWVRKWAEKEGHTISVVFSDEGISGRILDRPGIQAALEAVARGEVEGLVATGEDRYARELVVQEAIFGTVWSKGGRLFTTHGEILQDDPNDPTRKLLRQFMGAIAEWEAANIRLRMLRGKRHKVREGGYGGGFVPYGYVPLNGTLQPDALEYPNVQRIVELRGEGLSFERIARALNEEGRTMRSGKPWDLYAVRRVVRNEAKRSGA